MHNRKILLFRFQHFKGVRRGNGGVVVAAVAFFRCCSHICIYTYKYIYKVYVAPTCHTQCAQQTLQKQKILVYKDMKILFI